MTMREGLRAATAEAHDRLDASVSGKDLTDIAAYSRFLQSQLSARLAVERWLTAHAAPADLPPATAPLLVEDLQALGRPFSLAPARFAPPADADPMGAAWAIAGSQMGNRAMLAHMRKSGGGDLPTAFLADSAMQAFWKQLRPRLERPCDPPALERAAAAARAVFATFTLAFDAAAPERAAA